MRYGYIWHIRRPSGSSLSWWYTSWIYNYLCSHCLWPLKLWIRAPFMARCTRYNICDKVCQWLATGRSVFPGYCDFLHQWNWQPWYNWNIVEKRVKHNNPILIQPTRTEIWLIWIDWLKYFWKWHEAP